MTPRRDAFRPILAAWLLAVALLASGSAAQAIDGIVAGDSTWSPDRNAAVMAADYEFAEAASPGVSANPRLAARRPANLARPAPWSQTYVAGEAIEGLPPPTAAGTAISPEGLPVPHHMYGGEQDAFYPGVMPGCDHCGVNCCGNWNSCGPAPIRCLLPRLDCSSLEFFGGVHGFTGPANRGGSGSFGFHEGLNWGTSLCGCGAFQVGAQWTQSNFEGNYLTTDERNQVFFTAGWFRRCDFGLQGGVVVDLLHDEWDYEADFAQIRGELSWRRCGDDFGFWFTHGVNEDNTDLLMPVDAGNDTIRVVTANRDFLVNDLYAFFWRRQFACGGEGRIFGGFTGESQGLVGADAYLPLNPCWNLRAGFLYVIPENADDGVAGFDEETWNVSLSLVWTPFGRPGCGPNYCRPLFNVADNGSFATRLVP